MDLLPHATGLVTLTVAARDLPARARFVTAALTADALPDDDTRVSYNFV